MPSSPHTCEHRAGWDAALADLRSRGWEAKLTCLAAPVQIEGRVPGGERFYFRARHDDAELSIGGPDPADGAPWAAEEPCEDASFLPADRGLVVILRLWDRYVRGSAAPC